jgi:DnaD/phage-associated family protein
MRVLIYLCSEGGEVDAEALCRACGCEDDEMRDALAFWRGAGVIETTGKSEKKSSASSKEEKPKEPEKKLRRDNEVPSYTSEQLGDILERREDIVTLIDECQNVLGKLLNYKEINVLIGLVDYLELDIEYILTLTAYCVSIGKKTLHYIEKTAFGLYDAGICTADQLSEELLRRERAAATEGKIRTLFGIGGRAFTTKEKKFINAWVNEFGYGEDIIEKAYEVTADATGNASIPYANSIIERWNAEGLRTLGEIEESYKKNAEAAKPAEGSFDTDSFFEAAVMRSLGKG